MPDTFVCPNCDAKYKLVRMEPVPGPTADDPEITCLSCGDPLLGRDGSHVLKYFPFDDGRRPRRKRLGADFRNARVIE